MRNKKAQVGEGLSQPIAIIISMLILVVFFFSFFAIEKITIRKGSNEVKIASEDALNIRTLRNILDKTSEQIREYYIGSSWFGADLGEKTGPANEEIKKLLDNLDFEYEKAGKNMQVGYSIVIYKAGTNTETLLRVDSNNYHHEKCIMSGISCKNMALLYLPITTENSAAVVLRKSEVKSE